MAISSKADREALARRAVKALDRDLAAEVARGALVERRTHALAAFLRAVWKPKGRDQVELVRRAAEEITWRLAHAIPPESGRGRARP